MTHDSYSPTIFTLLEGESVQFQRNREESDNEKLVLRESVQVAPVLLFVFTDTTACKWS